MKTEIAIIGGGAAGFFLAITLKRESPDCHVTIFEKSLNVLSKVAMSGGGRCNLTNSFVGISDLSKVYPRGDKLLKRAFKVFDHRDTYQWFEDNSVELVTQEDNCVFPQSQNSQSIIDCFLRLAKELNISIKTLHPVKNIIRHEDASQRSTYEVVFDREFISNQKFDKVAITTGGSPKIEGFQYIEALGHSIMAPMPSLFTFNIPSDSVRELMGTVVRNTIVSLQGTKIKSSGVLLITHWGMSGPAILKLSSYGAPILNERDYRFGILVNWIGESDWSRISSQLEKIANDNPHKHVSNIRPFDLPSRLWVFLLSKIEMPSDRKWNELGRKGLNKIINILSNDEYLVHGKGQFRDEFVTCGGVSLESIDSNTMESKACRGLYFAGEVLDIDAITGGFNFQAAWTTAYIAAISMSRE